MKSSFLVLIASLFLITGCLKSDFEIQKRVEVLFLVDNLNTDLFFGQDTLRIEEFKYAVNSFSLITEDSTELRTDSEINALIFGYDASASGDRIVISTGLGFELNGFVSYELSLAPVEDGATILDPDFFGGDNNYSIIIEGSVNGESFTYRTDIDFIKKYFFDPIFVTDTNETIFLRSRIDMEKVFVDAEDNFLNPRGSTNTVAINEKIREELNAEAFLGTIFF